MSRRSPIVYGVLLATWLAILGWQLIEHSRVTRAARAALVNRSRDISTTLELVIRSQRRFGGIVSQERLESALSELVKTGELKSVALLNAAGSIVASAGEPVSQARAPVTGSYENWGDNSVTLVNLIDLGTNVVQEGEGGRPIIVLPRRDGPGATNDGFRQGPRSWWRGNRDGTNPPPPGMARPEGRRDWSGTNGPPRPSPFGRPPWLSEAEYKSLIEKQGAHSFIMVMSTTALRMASRHDLWLRTVISVFASMAAAGLAIAWRNVAKTSELQIRLVRASELNNHLKEMNLAAAGLAHETRNPLNIIRGHAQLISRQADATPEIRSKSREITDEVDRVTAQLTEFINYSKPREVRRAPVVLASVIGEVVRALQSDLEDKAIRLTVDEEGLTIDSDEQMLRQLLFNLVINAIQAVPSSGSIHVATRVTGVDDACLEISDDGPGVPASNRQEIFKPYFTTNPRGTGLGLAIVHQIVLAHGWEVRCHANEPTGALFRISHMKLSSKA